MSREPLTPWPLALAFLLVLGVAWLVMQPFRLMLRDGPADDSG